MAWGLSLPWLLGKKKGGNIGHDKQNITFKLSCNQLSDAESQSEDFNDER